MFGKGFCCQRVANVDDTCTGSSLELAGGIRGSVVSKASPRKPPLTLPRRLVGEPNGENLPAELSGTVGFLSPRSRSTCAAIVGLGVPIAACQS